MTEPLDSTHPIQVDTSDVRPRKIGMRSDGSLGLITENFSSERAELEHKIAEQLRLYVAGIYGEVSDRIRQIKDTSRAQLTSEGHFLKDERKGLAEKENDLFSQIQESSIDEVVFQQKAEIVGYLTQLQQRIQQRTISYPESSELIQRCRESQNDLNEFIKSYVSVFSSFDVTNLDAHLADYDRVPGFTGVKQQTPKTSTKALTGLLVDYFSKYHDDSRIQLVDESFPIENEIRIRWGITVTKNGLKFFILDTSVMRIHEPNATGIDALYPVNILASTYQTVLEEKFNLQKRE